MDTLKILELELAGGPYHMIDKENLDITAQKIDHAKEEMNHLEDTQETTQEITQETTQETDIDTEDILIEVTAEKVEEIMRKTGTGRPAMATKGNIERVARSPQVMGGLL